MKRVYCAVALFMIIFRPEVVSQSVLPGENICVSDCTGVTNGDYQSCLSCAVYVTCSNEQIFEDRPCPPGLFWNDDTKGCAVTTTSCNLCTLTSVNNCDENFGKCTVTGSTSVSCECVDGYEGDGFTCQEILTPSPTSPPTPPPTSPPTSPPAPSPTSTPTSPPTSPPSSSCSDIYASDPSSQDGEYTISNGAGDMYEVYCEFLSDSLYEYIKPTNLASLNIDDQYNDKGEFLLRSRLDDGEQYEAKITQLSKYSERDISVQYNSNDGYGDIQNTAMGPYLYIGLLPIDGIRHFFDIQGYRVNGRSRSFINCNGNAFSYFALLFNDAGASYTSFNYDDNRFERWQAAMRGNFYNLFSQVTGQSITPRADRVPAAREIPAEYFSQFEIRTGGCGGYLTLDDRPGVTGITIGLKSNILGSTSTMTSPASTPVTSTETSPTWIPA